MSKLLFIGTFLSHKRGTKSISERLYENLSCEFDIILVSKKENKILRILEIIHSIKVFLFNLAIIIILITLLTEQQFLMQIKL